MCCYNAGQATLKRMIAVQSSHCVSHYLPCFRLLLFCYKQGMEHLRDILKTYEFVFIVLLLNLQNDLIYIKKRYAMIAPGIPEVQTN